MDVTSVWEHGFQGLRGRCGHINPVCQLGLALAWSLDQMGFIFIPDHRPVAVFSVRSLVKQGNGVYPVRLEAI